MKIRSKIEAIISLNLEIETMHKRDKRERRQQAMIDNLDTIGALMRDKLIFCPHFCLFLSCFVSFFCVFGVFERPIWRRVYCRAIQNIKEKERVAFHKRGVTEVKDDPW